MLLIFWHCCIGRLVEIGLFFLAEFIFCVYCYFIVPRAFWHHGRIAAWVDGWQEVEKLCLCRRLQKIRKDRVMREIHHHLLRDDLRIDHAMINPRSVAILAQWAGTDLEMQTQTQSDFQVQSHADRFWGWWMGQHLHFLVIRSRGDVWWAKAPLPSCPLPLRKISTQWLLAVSHLDLDLTPLLKDGFSSFSVKCSQASGSEISSEWRRQRYGVSSELGND